MGFSFKMISHASITIALIECDRSGKSGGSTLVSAVVVP